MPLLPAHHDQAPAVPDPNPAHDLGAALSRLQIQGAIFLRADYTEGWAFRSVPGKDLGSLLAPGAARVIPFHVIAEGRCWLQVEGDQRRWAETGDVVLLPYGDQHTMGGTVEAEIVDATAVVSAPPWDQMPVISHGAGGDLTRFICGYVVCDDPLFDPALRVLPSVVVVTPTGPAASWVRASVDYALQQTTLVGVEQVETPPDVIRALLVETLKLHLASAPAAERGFVRALRDPVVAGAMARIHQAPQRKWTVAELAAEVAVSVSLLDERFRSELGMPPIRYLTAWRMHRAQDLLTASDLGVAAIARQVGYDSEEAFSRAFKRMHGVPPSVWRTTRG